jgi:putative peptidoglycan lipid II flippase
LGSRVLGYVRDSLNAALFGAGWVADAYFVAFRIPNMLRDLVGEGALSAAVIPTITRSLARRGEKDAHRLVSALLTAVAMGGVVVVAAGYFLAPAIVSVMAPGFSSLPRKFALTVSLTRWLFPFIAFISLAAAVMGWLNARERFGAPAFAPVALNLAVILGGMILCPLFGASPETQIYGWTAGVLLGGLAQWLVQVPAAREEGFRFRWRLWHPGLSEIGALMAPALAGFSFTQIHLLVNTILASLLPEGSVARIYYGNRLMQLPLGVFGVALSTAAYPAVARALVTGKIRSAADSLNRALKLTAFAVFPASAGLIALSPQINGLLFRFGRFSSGDADVTARIAVAYAVGIIGHSVVRVLTPPFYAAGRPYVPVMVAGIGVAANVLLSTILMLRLGVIGLPLSTSLVALICAGWLLWRLKSIVPGTGGAGVVWTFLKCLAASALMGAAVWAGVAAVDGRAVLGGLPLKVQELVLTFGGIAAGAGIFAFLAWVLRIRELGDFVRAILRRAR